MQTRSEGHRDRPRGKERRRVRRAKQSKAQREIQLEGKGWTYEKEVGSEGKREEVKPPPIAEIAERHGRREGQLKTER